MEYLKAFGVCAVAIKNGIVTVVFHELALGENVYGGSMLDKVAVKLSENSLGDSEVSTS